MQYIIPVIILIIITISLIRTKNTYETFTDGAYDGMKIVLNIFPTLLAVMMASYMLRESGTFDIITNWIFKIIKFIPREVVPLCLIRPISGSGATGVLTEILKNYGTDTNIGKLASTIAGSTETTFYCLCVYFSKTKVKYNGRIIPYAILGDIVSILTAIYVIYR